MPFVLPLLVAISADSMRWELPPALSPTGPSFADALRNSASYGLLASALQVVAGVALYAAVEPIRRATERNRAGIVPFILDTAVLAPYLTPTATWRAVAASLFEPNGSAAHAFPFLPSLSAWTEVLFVSTFHLAPFVYLALRLSQPTMLSSSRGPDLRDRVSPRFDDLISLVSQLLVLFAFRAFVMAGKFDIPYLFGGNTPVVQPKLVTIPVFLELARSEQNWQEAGGMTAYVVLFILSLSFVAAALLSRNAGRSMLGFLIRRYRPVIALSLSGETWLRCHWPGVLLALRVAGVGYLFTLMLLLGTAVSSEVSRTAIADAAGAPVLIALAITLIVTAIATVLALGVARALVVSACIRPGPLLLALDWMLRVYYVLPVAVYFLAMKSGVLDRIPSWVPDDLRTVGGYIVLIAVVSMPLAYFQLRTAIPRYSALEQVFLHTSGSTGLSLTRLYGGTLRPIGAAVAVVMLAITTNELFGARLLLSGFPTVNLFLANSAPNYNEDLGWQIVSGFFAAVPNSLATFVILRGGARERLP